MQEDDLQWKILLDYDASTDKINLLINDKPFDDMPYLAEITHKSPQNIEDGTITLNGKVLHSGWMQCNFDTISDWISSLEHPTTDISIRDLNCTSVDVVNSVFDFIGRTVDKEEGIKNLAIENF